MYPESEKVCYCWLVFSETGEVEQFHEAQFVIVFIFLYFMRIHFIVFVLMGYWLRLAVHTFIFHIIYCVMLIFGFLLYFCIIFEN